MLMKLPVLDIRNYLNSRGSTEIGIYIVTSIYFRCRNEKFILLISVCFHCFSFKESPNPEPKRIGVEFHIKKNRAENKLILFSHVLQSWPKIIIPIFFPGNTEVSRRTFDFVKWQIAVQPLQFFSHSFSSSTSSLAIHSPKFIFDPTKMLKLVIRYFSFEEMKEMFCIRTFCRKNRNSNSVNFWPTLII